MNWQTVDVLYSSNKLVITRSPRTTWSIFSSFLTFCCYFTRLKARETNPQNMIHSKNIGCIALGTMVYRSIWLGNTYYNYCSLENLLNIRPRGFDRQQYCIAWYMVEFSKQIANTLKKILMATSKDEFKTLSNIWDGSFCSRFLLTSEANSESCQNI